MRLVRILILDMLNLAAAWGDDDFLAGGEKTFVSLYDHGHSG
jgi:hypothetical protein